MRLLHTTIRAQGRNTWFSTACVRFPRTTALASNLPPLHYQLMIILASTSPARRRLLHAAGVVFEAHRPLTDETVFKQEHPDFTPKELAKGLAQAKAESLRFQYPGALVIGCDQVLSCESRMFDKPRDNTEAMEHLAFLQGKTHTLHTALCCIDGTNPPYFIVSEPNLTMRALQKTYLEEYLEKADPDILSCVGCYQIEGLGAQLFDSIDGDMFSIQGLPLLPLLAHLRAGGYIST